MDDRFTIEVGSNQEEAVYIRQRLVEFNLTKLEPAAYAQANEQVNVVLKEKDGTIIGGITGFTKMNCLHIEIFWLDESLRGKGIGGELLKRAEYVGKEKGCNLVKLDTFSFQAPGFYLKQGYTQYGVLEDFPQKGSSQFFYYKKLS